MSQEQEEQRLAVLKRIQQLEGETAVPERRDAAKARKKIVKDLQSLLGDTALTADNKIGQLQDRLLGMVGIDVRIHWAYAPRDLSRRPSDYQVCSPFHMMFPGDRASKAGE